jgi:hypothetical protein
LHHHLALEVLLHPNLLLHHDLALAVL